jgi:acyl-CoA thioester hydrolase
MSEGVLDPLVTWRGTVSPDWVDYNGHLRDAYYGLIFSFATDAWMDQIGLDEQGRADTGHTLYTLEAHLNFLLEVRVETAVEVHTQILGADQKRVQVFHTLLRSDNAAVLATTELMLCNIDTTGSRAAAFAPSVASRLAPVVQAHRLWPRPPQAGRSIALPTPRP